MSRTRKLFTLGLALLVLMALVPLVSAHPNRAPLAQATATPTEAATGTAVASPTVTATSAVTATATLTGTAVGTPSTLPETGAEVDTTPWALLLIIAIGVVVLLVGISMAAANRSRIE